ncbi:MAG: response regulator [Deferribacteres bacterium]|nr:response regulator [candidate division KSB1 bacterium]MCB9502826.1 response regulator [Deferribacteres bacterium]
MENTSIKLLLVEDDRVDQLAFKRVVERNNLGFEYTIANTLREARDILQTQRFDVIITDFNLGDGDALEVMQYTKDMPVIVATGVGDEEIAVKAMKEGACDYLIKDRKQNYIKTLPLTIENVLKTRKMQHQFRMLSHAMKSVSDAIWITDLNANVIFVNEAFIKTVLFERKEILGTNIWHLFKTEGTQHSLEKIQSDTLRGGWGGEILCKRKNGLEFSVYLSTSMIFDENDEPISYSGIIKDISIIKKAERDSGYHASAPDITKLLIVEDDVVDQMAFKRMVKQENLAYEIEFAKSVADAGHFLQNVKFDIVISDYSLGDGDAFDVIKLVGETPMIIITGAGDEEIAVKAMKVGAYDYVIKDPHRNYLKTVPITIENAIKNKSGEKRYKMLSHALMSINDSVWISDLSDNILFINDAFYNSFGYLQSELVGKSISIIHSSKTPAEIIEQIQMETICGGWNGELLATRKDGSEFPIFLSTSIVYNESGVPLALTGVAKDITEQKRVHEDLRQAKEMAEQTSRMKSEFLANMSHEIRTPMNGIIGMTDLALDTELSGEQREYLGLVKSSAESLLTIINDILDFSKIEAGKFQLVARQFQLRDKIDEVIKTFAFRAEQKELGFQCTIPHDVPDVLIGDPGRLGQIIINLIGNAIKFTDNGGIVFKVEREWEHDHEICLHFSVTDSGIGISQVQQQSIFDSFVQADSSLKREYGGTGLGLAISSKLVQLMNGKIWVESPVVSIFSNEYTGNGSCFHFLLSFRLGNDAEEAPLFDDFVYSNKNIIAQNQQMEPKVVDITAVKSADFASNKSILVAEDNVVNQKVIIRILEKLNFQVTLAKDGLNTLQYWREKEFALIFMDIQMPDMDGIEATQAIRQVEKQKGGHIPIIALTANAMKGDRERFLDAGMDDYISKPINRDELMQILYKYIPDYYDLPNLQELKK